MDIFVVMACVVRNYNDRRFMVDNDIYTDAIRVCNSHDYAIEKANEAFENLKKTAKLQMLVKENDDIDEFECVKDGIFEYEFVCNSGSCNIKIEIAKPPVWFR